MSEVARDPVLHLLVWIRLAYESILLHSCRRALDTEMDVRNQFTFNAPNREVSQCYKLLKVTSFENQ